MALFNFKLRHPDLIHPWGTPPNATMHWFGLTDSEYWLEIGTAKVYEYSDAVLQHWEVEDFKCVDYQAIRLIEDLTGIFHSIAEPVPDEFYALAKNHQSLYHFYAKAKQWLDHISDQPEVDVDTYLDRYDQLIEWLYSRTLSAMHLTHGPDISFFRNNDRLSIVWNAERHTDEQIPVWTTTKGEAEMKYEEFVKEWEDFGNRFFKAMQQQVDTALNKDWGTTDINKTRLIEEQIERELEFQESVLLLKNGSAKQTDWDLVTSLIADMNREEGK